MSSEFNFPQNKQIVYYYYKLFLFYVLFYSKRKGGKNHKIKNTITTPMKCTDQKNSQKQGYNSFS